MAAAELCRAAGTTMPTLRRMAADGAIALEAQRPRRERAGVGGRRGAARRDAPPDAHRRPGARRSRAVRGAMRDGGHAAAARGDRVGQDRGLPARDRRGPGGRARRDRPRPRDRPDAPAAVAPAGAPGRGRERVALGDVAGRARRGAPARARGRGRRRARARAAPCSRPVARLGLVVVDEEHDASYKQDATPALRRPPGGGAAGARGRRGRGLRHGDPAPRDLAGAAAAHAARAARRLRAAADRGRGHAHAGRRPGVEAARRGAARGRRRAARRPCCWPAGAGSR